MIRSTPIHIRILCAAGIHLCLLAHVGAVQRTEEQARKEAQAQTAAALHLSATQFLSTQRREDLEHMFETATGKSGTLFIYEVSNEGDEVRGSAVIHHLSSDASLNFLVGVLAAPEKTFRIGGFGDSLSEFNRMMADSQTRVLAPERAQYIADLYFAINPERIQFVLLRSPLGMKQAVERQCHANGGDFVPVDKQFAEWWTRHRPMIVDTKFAAKVSSAPGGFRVQVFTLSSPIEQGGCGASIVEATVEVSSSGTIKPVSFKGLSPSR